MRITKLSTKPKALRPLRVFLCHSSDDKPAVRKLYRRLQSLGFDPWLDEEKLLPGQDFRQEIPRAVRAADAVLVCLSQKSITKEGYVQKEIRFALDAAEEKPDGTIYIIPVKLEECEVPERLASWHWVNLFDKSGHERLIKSLRLRAEMLGTSGGSGTTTVSQSAVLEEHSKATPNAGNTINAGSTITSDIPPIEVKKVSPVSTASKETGWRNWGDHPLVAAVGVAAAIIAIIVFVTGRDNFFALLSGATDTTIGNKNTSPTVFTTLPSFGTGPTLVATAGGVVPTQVFQSTLTIEATTTPTATDTATATATLTPNSPTATTSPGDAVVISDNLNLRSGPGTNYPIIDTYIKGEVLTIDGKIQNNEWINVTTSNGRKGWMFLENLQVNIDLSSIPLSSIPPSPTLPPATATPKPKPTPQPQQIAPTIAPTSPPTSAPVANLDGTWVGTTSVGGTIDFVVSNGKVTNIHFAFPASIEPSKERDCSANGSWAGYESWLNQLRITIGADGSFSGRNIQIRGLDRLLAEFSGSLTSSGSASGRLREEITASETCKIISSFDWSATK